MITGPEIYQSGSSLRSKSGPSEQIGRENHTPNSTLMNVEFIERGQWIKLNGKKILWLPPEYRPQYCAVNGSLLAFSDTSGRILFIGFHV
jgi:hypothetical protein